MGRRSITNSTETMTDMTQQQLKISYDLPHCYIEVARAAMTSFHHPAGADAFLQKHTIEPIANAKAALVSVSIVYSYLAVEAFVNSQLYNVWKRRHDGSVQAERLLALLGYVAPFEALKGHKRVRGLSERIKTVCQILDIKPPHEGAPKVWQDFIHLVEVSRHFVIHPTPDPEYFQEHMERIMTETKAGKYADTARDIIGNLYDASGESRPEWLTKNTLLKFRGVDLLVNHEG